MSRLRTARGLRPAERVPARPAHLAPCDAAAARILEVQTPDGAIPWFEDGPWDPWNHAECAMALTAMGETEAAARAFAALQARQSADGSWECEYGNALPMADRLHIARTEAPVFRDTNFAAYCATAVWHLAESGADRARLETLWPMVSGALDFVLGFQAEDGTISWSAEAAGTEADDALPAAHAAIYKSLDCGLRLARRLGHARPDWRRARTAIARALAHVPERFNRARPSHAGFAMDWYYPVLTGAVTGTAARDRLATDWSRFVVPGEGCLCVDNEPWVTVAETAELAIAVLALGGRDLASQLLDRQFARLTPSGAFWMGWQTEEAIVWPEEAPSWTQAAVILALDALHGTGPAARVLVGCGAL